MDSVGITMTENYNGKSGTADGMKDNFKKATTEMLVLFLLGEKPMYVYEMIQALDHRSNSAYSVATLYPAIYRLQKFGFIREYAKCVSEDNKMCIRDSPNHCAGQRRTGMPGYAQPPDGRQSRWKLFGRHGLRRGLRRRAKSNFKPGRGPSACE